MIARLVCALIGHRFTKPYAGAWLSEQCARCGASACERDGHVWGPPNRDAGFDQRCLRCGTWKGWKP